MRRDRRRRLPVDAGGRRRRAVLNRRGWRLSEWVEVIGGLGLLVASFLPWYSDGGESATAWQAFGLTDFFLAAAVVAGLSVPAVVLSRISVSYPVAGSTLAALFGGIALILVVIRLISPPGDGGVDVEYGAWVGLVGAAAITYGGYLGMQEPSGHQAALFRSEGRSP